MCGISGYIDFKKEILNDEMINKMISTIEHRGPDGKGVLINYPSKEEIENIYI